MFPAGGPTATPVSRQAQFCVGGVLQHLAFSHHIVSTYEASMKKM
jgi:hypothetical protein